MKSEPMSNQVSHSETWETFYENDQTGWERHETHPALLAWLNDGTIKSLSHIAIPGCGRGSEPLELAKRGFPVTAIDFSATAIEFQVEQLKELDSTTSVLRQDVFNFEPPEAFDIVYEQTCLCAINPERRSEYEQSIFKWLKPGGLLLVLFMQTDPGKEGPPFHCDVESMKSLFHESRWHLITEPSVRYNHPSGKVFELAACLQRKDTDHAG